MEDLSMFFHVDYKLVNSLLSELQKVKIVSSKLSFFIDGKSNLPESLEFHKLVFEA